MESFFSNKFKQTAYKEDKTKKWYYTNITEGRSYYFDDADQQRIASECLEHETQKLFRAANVPRIRTSSQDEHINRQTSEAIRNLRSATQSAAQSATHSAKSDHQEKGKDKEPSQSIFDWPETTVGEGNTDSGKGNPGPRNQDTESPQEEIKTNRSPTGNTNSSPPKSPQPTPPRTPTPPTPPAGNPGSPTGNMAQPPAGPHIKYPKPNRYYGDPRLYRPWMVSLELYFNSYGITTDNSKINYTLGLLEGAASNWKSDFIATHPNYPNWTDFKNSLEQAFAPAQQGYEAEQKLRRYRQNGEYIEHYISGFSVLSSQAGLPDSTALRAYFAEGLDKDVRIEAIRFTPTTLQQWKDAARNAFRIVMEQRKASGNFGQSSRSHKPYKKNKHRSQKSIPRYSNIYNEPVQHKPARSEWDMDVDQIYFQLNQLGLDNESEDSESESEESESEDSDDEEVNFIRQRRTQTQTPKQAVQGFINAILTDEQRAALKRGECFFCHKKGHWYRDCRARKLYIKQGGRTSMDRNPGTDRKKKQGNGKPKKQKTWKKKEPIDPNAMVYNIEEEEDNFEEFSKDGNF
ncbi:hypothetical protein AGABI1DRAFT_93686 [Agaricus bisporus var. burnettii JB137-S8]|uniref:CCHC-type domain-containing protein n=1 Tax=Agaricus bisporus var. burnettii (strain JB137-S8 / ATCC MYA-4627 / FGSC 10392) TaxID=597362 RepID=K5VRD0_AGABU|nr:uncharacterized protein AGABI1DRAFT_93686 [Agaricus bisporus var. burnettii JB137-S8]EKM77024.1 hypothetical protein AGABI1DRAFT_93686 [Agaricus bisporus var. burnettii JB137-S8]